MDIRIIVGSRGVKETRENIKTNIAQIESKLVNFALSNYGFISEQEYGIAGQLVAENVSSQIYKSLIEAIQREKLNDIIAIYAIDDEDNEETQLYKNIELA